MTIFNFYLAQTPEFFLSMPLKFMLGPNKHKYGLGKYQIQYQNSAEDSQDQQ